MKTVGAGALGECVHVAGVMNLLRLAEAAGWRTIFRQACTVHHTDHWWRGRRLDRLGIAQLSVSEVMRYVIEEAR